MRGRYPSGPEFVDHVSGSVIAKDRARVLLETIAGTCRVKEACTRLGVSEPRFDQLRIHGVERLVQSMEPRAAGRPPRMSSPAAERVRELEAKVAALEMQVKIAQARAEIALVLPNAVHDGGDNGMMQTPDQGAENKANRSAAGKKTTQKRRPRRQRRQPPRIRAPAT